MYLIFLQVFGIIWKSSYRESLERKKDIESIKEDEKYLVNIPYSEMAKRNWNCIEQTRDPYEKVINLRKFFLLLLLVLIQN